MPTLAGVRPAIKALTICQPWAWAIVAGHKRIENRSWPTRYRGPLAIHAGLSRRWLPEGEAFIRRQGIWLPPDLEFGAIVGLVDLVDCLPLAAVADDPWASGPVCWVLANPRPITPRPWRGALGLFSVPADALD